MGAAGATLTAQFLFFSSGQAAAPSGVFLPEGQAVLSASTALEKRLYARPASPDQAAVVIRGEGFTVDFRGAILQGAAPAKVPASDFKGIGILLDGCRDVTLRNAVVNGYMVGILVMQGSCDNLFAYNRATPGGDAKADAGNVGD